MPRRVGHVRIIGNMAADIVSEIVFNETSLSLRSSLSLLPHNRMSTKIRCSFLLLVDCKFILNSEFNETSLLSRFQINFVARSGSSLIVICLEFGIQRNLVVVLVHVVNSRYG